MTGTLITKGPSRRTIVGTAAAVMGFPYISRAQAKAPIKIGMPTVLSGPYTVIGETCRAATQLALDKFNADGGLDGRMVDVVVRDDKAKPDEAARVIREFINSDKVDLILAASTTAGAFAIQEVVRETGHLCIHTVSETSTLTADPKMRAPNSFRVCRQGVQDSIAAAQAASALIKARGIKKWMTVCQDFAYGRAIQTQFVAFLKQMEPGVEIVATSWPKFQAPDYTDTVTQILSVAEKEVELMTDHQRQNIGRPGPQQLVELCGRTMPVSIEPCTNGLGVCVFAVVGIEL